MHGGIHVGGRCKELSGDGCTFSWMVAKSSAVSGVGRKGRGGLRRSLKVKNNLQMSGCGDLLLALEMEVKHFR